MNGIKVFTVTISERSDNIELRPYQQELITSIRQSIKQGNKSIVAVLGCGGGKSIIQGTIAKLTTDKNNRVLFLVHRKELCEQIEDTFFKVCGVDPKLCEIMMIQTARKRLDKLLKPSLILVDEAHLFNKAYEKIFNFFPDSYKLGFTATPCRLNQGGLGNLFKDIQTGVSTRWMIDNNYLSDYKYYSFPIVDTTNLCIRSGEFIPEEINALIENKAVYAGAVEQYLKITPNKKAMVYCNSIKASKEIAEEFKKNGVPAAHVDGSTPKNKREKIVEDYRNGKIKVISNVDLFGVGFDDKDIEATILLRPTMSLALYIQMSMRSMRYKKDKIAYILDCSGNVTRHGLPDDDRTWSLETKKKQESIIKIRECVNCYAVFSPALSSCPYCGFQATKEIVRKDKKQITVDLVEVERQNKIKNTKLSDANFKTFEEVREYQRLRHLKFAFCLHYCLQYGIPIPNKYKYQTRYLKQ